MCDWDLYSINLIKIIILIFNLNGKIYLLIYFFKGDLNGLIY